MPRNYSEICRDVGICDAFMAVAIKDTISGFYLGFILIMLGVCLYMVNAVSVLETNTLRLSVPHLDKKCQWNNLENVGAWITGIHKKCL